MTEPALLPRHQKRRHTYVIGDLQGCFSALKALLRQIEFDAAQDYIYFAGDLVARGEDSLGCLRFVKKLSDQGAASTVLGNHDLTLLACFRGFKQVKAKDKTQPILEAIDGSDLIDWLRQQPLLIEIDGQHVLTHAGIPHIWTLQQARQYAREIEAVLTTDLATLDEFLANMYGSQPDTWSEQLHGQSRLRMITNYFTRMRLINPQGQLEFDFKSGLHDPLPAGFAPWYNFAHPVMRTHRLLFGHWAALLAQPVHPQVIALDGGCVWGADLVAWQLDTGRTVRQPNPWSS